MARRWMEVADAHQKLLDAAKTGDFDATNILGNGELFELGKMQGSILHSISENWSVELGPLFCAVMTEVKNKKPELLFWEDCFGRTFLNSKLGMRNRNHLVKFFFDKYPSEAIEVIKRYPRHLTFLLSVWREVDWSLIAKELRGLLPERMEGDKDQNTFLHCVVQFPLKSGSADDGELVETIVREIIQAEPSTLFSLNGQQKSVYQWCIETLNKIPDVPHEMDCSDNEADSVSDGNASDSDRSDEGDRDEGCEQNCRYIGDKTPAEEVSKSAEPKFETLLRVANMLKEQIIRFGDNLERIRQLIFVEGREEHEIDLDFSEFDDNEDSEALSKFIESLDLQVEGLLRNVKLPATKVTKVWHSEAREGAISKFFADLKAKHNVKRIMYLEVDEDVEYPCSDAVIEAALSGIKIDTLDWRSSIISFEAVANAVPDVQCLHLYWNGRGYLSSWLVADTLLTLPKLKKVILTVLQPDGRQQESNTNCIIEFRRSCENIDVGRQIVFKHNIPEAAEGTWSSIIHGGQPGIKLGSSSVNNRETWIQRLQDFCQQVSDKIDPQQSVGMVPRVAIIDDGVNMAKFPREERPSVIEGRSFTSTPSWFFSTTGRGTAIARIISSLSPNIHILVARTDNSIETGGKSIAMALKWCIDKGVDIICLGSTLGISPRSEAPEESIVDELCGSVQGAIDDGIIVLMPTWERSVEDPTMETYSLRRYSLKGNSLKDGILRIGTSRWIGSVELPADPEADFTLIDEIPRKLGDSDKEGTLKAAKGNFVSTAIAAGLAASILICARHDRQKAGRFRGERMTRVFKSLQGSGNSKMIMTANLTKLSSKQQNPDYLARHFVNVSKG
ncbi:hypothetical protein GGR51DRAFT_90875 [Nemania sp. FL0031]|nr:hypothetical protein GGR51DRAFT_90875 [Nemania sp. FL0031]